MNEQLDLFESSEEERLPQDSKLTPRQWALYRLIHRNSFVEHRKTTQKEIYDKLKDYGYEWTESNNTSDHCSTIWNDVTANNLSDEHDTLIITENYVYWIGSPEETKMFLRKLWKSISPKLQRYWFYVSKVGMDGQGKLYDKNLNPIYNEGAISDNAINTKLFHDCFNEYDISMQNAIELDDMLNKKEYEPEFDTQE